MSARRHGFGRDRGLALATLAVTVGAALAFVLAGPTSSAAGGVVVSPPSLTGLTPSQAPAGTAKLTLHVLGDNLPAGAIVCWNGSPLPTTFTSAQELQADLSEKELSTPMTVDVTVALPVPSAAGVVAVACDLPRPLGPLTFTVTKVLPPSPTLSKLDPPDAVAGTTGLTLRALGDNLPAGAIVCWNGSPLPTKAISAQELQAAVSDTLLSAPGSVPVTVALPSAQGAPAACDLANLLGPLTFAVTEAPPPPPPPPVPPLPTPGIVPSGLLPPDPTLPGAPGLPGGTVSGAAGALDGPVVTGLSAGDLFPGGLLTISGQNLGKAPGTVLVRGVAAPIVSWTSTRVLAFVPDIGPGAADVRLLVGGQALGAPGTHIRSVPNQPPVVNLLVLPTARGLTFLFDATLSVDPEGLGGPLEGKAENGLAAGLRSVLWRFGDGSQSTQPVVRHTYRSPGDYRVTLRVTDGDGRSSTTTQTVTAEAVGRPTFRPINIRIPSQIVFDFGASALRPASRSYLVRVAKVVRRAASRTRVAGYTDSSGPVAFNQRLSLTRARTVKGFLSRRGQVAAREMFAVGFGERRPLASNATERGRQKNRRVVLTFRLGARSFARI